VVIVEEKRYYLLMTDADDVRVNRRDSYRVYVGIPGTAKLGANIAECEAIVKDVSESGIAFIAKNFKLVILGSIIRLTFHDMKQSMGFDIQAIVIRKEPVKKDECVYGCIIQGKYPKLSKYIARKQIEHLREERLNKDNF